MKKSKWWLVPLWMLLLSPAATSAQDPITLLIQQGITKVIKAVDLKIQRLQTKTIWLQNAQKVIENAMSRLRLDEITTWVEKHRLLYQDYFQELQQVKGVLTWYSKVKQVTALQLAIARAYERSYNGIRQDSHFSSEEVKYMASVYAGIIEESLKNLDGLYLAINSFATQMTDEKRMEIIDNVQKAMQKNYDDLRSFSGQNLQLSMSRAKDQSEILSIRQLYGLQ